MVPTGTQISQLFFFREDLMYFIPGYHTPADNIKEINLDYLQKSSQMLSEYVLHLAEVEKISVEQELAFKTRLPALVASVNANNQTGRDYVKEF
jgi:aminopeptidase-like protein